MTTTLSFLNDKISEYTSNLTAINESISDANLKVNEQTKRIFRLNAGIGAAEELLKLQPGENTTKDLEQTKSSCESQLSFRQVELDVLQRNLNKLLSDRTYCEKLLAEWQDLRNQYKDSIGATHR